MKVFLYVLFSCLLWWGLGLVVTASTRQQYNNSTPDEILQDIVWAANGKLRDQSQIVVTKLDGTTNSQIFGVEHKLSGTLESVRQNISYYLQWIAYFALAGAVTLIIYNGLMLVISPLSPDEASKVKTRMIYIATGIVLVTWFYFVLKILLAIYYDIFVD